ncbi:nucleoside permease [Apibacter adventoris]|uniref:MFS transporter n=1 Tax=Apibacter adventoris TaxID=1679466 RepID=A0A2S8AEV5_9FLAO|nr:nucleoside permease [Apibacter adventoris]PQL94172.1 MFS transporter [Apibacter adventoris]
MTIKLRLIILVFLQYFVWGAWLISLGGYAGLSTMEGGLGFSGIQIGSLFATMGIASLFMPGLLGIIADRWMNAERVLGASHLIAALFLIIASQMKDYAWFYTFLLLHTFFYMPTLALTNTVSYNALEKNGLNSVTAFPPIRVWGTVGFIVAMWIVDLLGFARSPIQLYVSSGAGIIMAIYSFTMPETPPTKSNNSRKLSSALGLDALILFKKKKMAIFFFFSMLLGCSLQITNAFGGPFLDSFKSVYPNSFGVKHPNLLLSISQISETLCILLIPFFLQKFGIKKVIMLSMLAWVLRFGLFGLGNPADRLYLLVLSMIVYGMAFDFFNISGSLFVENETDKSMRASGQGLFMIMTNGLGAILGSYGSGWVVQHFTKNNITDWPTVWFIFAGYSLFILIIFPFAFRPNHHPDSKGTIHQ